MVLDGKIFCQIYLVHAGEAEFGGTQGILGALKLTGGYGAKMPSMLGWAGIAAG